MNTRLSYIDCLKGMAMMMVVIGHTIIFCGLGYDNDYVKNIVLINMPLFLFLNGLVVRKMPAPKWGGYLISKFRQIMIPFLVWGGLITLYRGECYSNFLLHFWKFGYWYLIVLFELYLIYYVIGAIAGALSTVMKKDVLWNGLLVGMIIIAYFAIRHSVRIIPDMVMSLTSYFQIVDYYPYFFLGVLFKQCDWTTVLTKHRNSVMTILLIATPTLYYVWYAGLFPDMIVMPLRFTMILTIYMLFVLADGKPTQSDTIGKGLKNVLITIGRHTLAIYMIQYFLFSFIDFHDLFKLLDESGNSLILIAISILCAAVLCYACIFIEKVMSSSSLFSVLFFGSNRNKPCLS